MNHGEIVSFLWGIADLIRDTFKRGKYQDVILPLTVLRRLDCVLERNKEKVLAKQAELRRKKLQNLDPQLRRASGYAFYNTSRYDFEKLLGDAPHLAANLRNYIAGFSPNMREVLEKFDFDNTIGKLDDAGLLFQVLERFKNVDLHPDRIDNPTMGTIFEELIRKFNEALNENPGEHFTPRDVVHLMADLMLAGDEARIRSKGVVRTVYDPCCGSGGMLMITKEHVTLGLRRNGDVLRPPLNPAAEIHLFGQEVNPETWAISKSDLFMKDPTGRDADHIAFGSTLSNDRHAGKGFDYLIAGSPLFTGDAGSGESEIRRHLLENDLLEALIALPEQLFYNTGIATYVWVVTNRKAAARRGRVQLIDAGAFWSPMRKSLGDKRREIPPERARDIVKLLEDFRDGDTRDGAVVSRIFPTTQFGFRKITVERPLRLDFQASPERIARLEEERGFQALAQSKKRGAAGTKEQREGRAQQEAIGKLLAALPTGLHTDRVEFERVLEAAAKEASLRLAAPVTKAILSALSERNEQAAVCHDQHGNPEPDPELRATESVPLSESVEAFFGREVKPHVPDAWIDTQRRDPKDGEVGLVGYEINFNRYFYRYTPPRPLEAIEAEIQALEKEIVVMLREVAD